MRRRLATALAGMLLALGVHAQEASPLTLGAGLHYSSGDYGTSNTTRITSLAAVLVAASVSSADAFCGFYVNGSGEHLYADATQG